jgi:hypothetical protein
VHRGSTLVFNVPRGETIDLQGIALIVDGVTVAVSIADTWPTPQNVNSI